MRAILFSMFLFFLLALSVGAHAQPYAPTTARPAIRPGPVTMPFKSAPFQDKRALVLAYSIDNPRAPEAVAFLQEMAAIKNEFNLEVVGVNINADRQDEVRRFHKQHGATFPVAFDTNGDLARHLRLRGDLTLYVFNRQGKLRGTVYGASVPAKKNLKRAFRAYVDRIFNLGFIPADEPVLGDRPPAPVFQAEALDGTNINLRQQYEKKPVVLVFFSPTCGHCRHELIFLQELLKTGEFKNAFSVVAVSRHNRDVTEKFVKDLGLAFSFLLDTDDAISSLFESFVGVVPVAYIIDTSGRIYAKHTGFSDRMRDLYYMELRHLLGRPGKPLLVPRGYSGHERCQICHEKQHIQWSLTMHANAIASVRRKGREDDPSCVSCHVTGWGQQGGYRIEDKATSRHLENVQCETCHGPGYQSCTAF
ncbi:MAG: redoxin domain-containing protein, partial [Deltaproteobacteria bacterium]|nr:redoxin domain-containing protein [Deltaproteobacteria bacterium]